MAALQGDLELSNDALRQAVTNAVSELQERPMPSQDLIRASPRRRVTRNSDSPGECWIVWRRNHLCQMCTEKHTFTDNSHKMYRSPRSFSPKPRGNWARRMPSPPKWPTLSSGKLRLRRPARPRQPAHTLTCSRAARGPCAFFEDPYHNRSCARSLEKELARRKRLDTDRSITAGCMACRVAKERLLVQKAPIPTPSDTFVAVAALSRLCSAV